MGRYDCTLCGACCCNPPENHKAGIALVEDRLDRLGRGLRAAGLAGKVTVRPTSAKWAWVEYMLAQGETRAGLAVIDAYRAGGNFAAYKKAVTPKPVPTIDLFHVAPVRISVIDTVTDLCAELPRRGPVSFRELTSSLIDRLDVVVHFLAVLELFKQGLVDLDQPHTFGDIRITWIAGDDVGASDLALVDAYDG